MLATLVDAPADDADAAAVRAAVAGYLRRAGDPGRAAGPEPARGDGPDELERLGLRSCYVCGVRFRAGPGTPGRLCPPCVADNVRHRDARADLTGRRAVVTGGRVKAGFELVLKLLRDGAAVTVLTRFPDDARRRFAAVPDRDAWAGRLTVTGADLRDVPRLVAWCDEQVAAGTPLDILVNLAAQTVRRPGRSYAALLAGERRPLPVTAPPGLLPLPVQDADGDRDVDEDAGRPPRWLTSAGTDLVDGDGLLPDPSPVNSWTRRVHEIDPVELLEVQLVNVTAPFLLLGRLRPLLERSPHPRRYVVNVSAAEGQFARPWKGAEHPHTNMAKAALNMLTRTGAAELAAHGIYLTSVDPGWFSDQLPDPRRERRAAAGFAPPLDPVDAAARVYHPIVAGEQGEALFGCLLKDFRPAPW